MELLSFVPIAMAVPFFLVLLVCGIAYLVDGYKKDLVRSVISLVATAIAVVISLLVAKLIAWAGAGSLLNALPSEVTEVLSVLGTLGESLVRGAFEIALSFCLFGLVFSIVLAILKAVGNRIPLGKLEKLSKGETGTRVAGMCIRGVDALIVTVMLLLPLYGTVAMAAPPAATVVRLANSATLGAQSMELSEEQYDEYGDYNEYPVEQTYDEMDELVTVLEDVAASPILVPYKYGPGAWVYSGLSSFHMNGRSVDISSAVNSMSGMIERVQNCISAIESENSQAAVIAVQDLIEFARAEVVNQQWSYEMVMAFVAEADKMIAQQGSGALEDAELNAMYAQVRPLLDMSFEEYTHNAEAILEFVGWGVEVYGKYGESTPPEEELAAVEKELFTRIGDLLNHSEQTIGLKRVLLQMAADRMFDTLPDIENPEYYDYYVARGDLPNSSVEFINKYFGDGIVSADQRYVEGALLIFLLDNSDALSAAELFVRHPLFGADAVLDTMDEYLYINGSEGGMGHQLAELDGASYYYDYLDSLLRSCADYTPNQSLTFSNTVYWYLSEDLGLEYDEFASYDEGYGGYAQVDVAY